MPIQHTAIFHAHKNDNFHLKICDCFFFIFAQNIDCGYTLEPPPEAVLTSTHDLCFRAKIRKNVYPGTPQFCYITSTHNLCFRAKKRKNVYPGTPQFCYIKVGCKGVYITWTYLHDVHCFEAFLYIKAFYF